jgi:hypothetical protein
MDINRVSVGHPDASGKATQDVIDLMLEQHQMVDGLMETVATRNGGERAVAFAALGDLLGRHEEAEQRIVHAATTDAAQAYGVAQKRIHEEDRADIALEELRDLGTDHPDFDAKFAAFRMAVADHARHEEEEEFPRLREVLDGDTLVRMARAVRVIEGIQPNR